jgi:hypothetical protein
VIAARRRLAGPAGRAALAVLAALAGLGAGQARGDRTRQDEPPRGALRDRTHRYQLVVADGWRPLAAPEGTLVAYGSDGGHLAITRVAAGTRVARDLETLAAQVERGVERVTRRFRPVRRKLSDSSRGAMLDLVYQRTSPDGPELVLSRYLFFSRHTVVLSIGLRADASRSHRRAAEAMVKSFTPLE